jgi:hypothetical protein
MGKFATVSDGAARSPAGPSDGWMSVSETGTGSQDVSEARGLFIRVQAITAGCYVWFDTTSTSTRKSTDQTSLTTQIPLWIPAAGERHWVVPEYSGSSGATHLHWDFGAGTGDIHICLG